jgi:minor extracellular serine protease Vpr
MKRLIGFLAVVAILLGTFAAPAMAQDGPTAIEPLVPVPVSSGDGELLDETPQLWFVEFANAPTSDGGNAARAKADKTNFHSQAKQLGLKYTERFAYQSLWNGISISVTPAELAKLNRMTGINAVYRVETYTLPPVQTEQPELFTALAMTGADIAQNELGYTGKGVKVAVMDTGIDYDHPDLGGCFGPGCRVTTGWDFVGDAFNADPTSPSFNPVPVPDNDPDDCNGHGTHVAGIVGASGLVTGVAPEVEFGAYRVFGCEGSTTADIMLAAMERSLADGMHVLNMSIGSAFQWPQYPTAQAADRLVNRGMVVVASIGNSGASGVYSAGAPGLGKKVIGVASFDNTNVALTTFTITPDDAPIGYGPASGAPLPPTSGSLEMARTGTSTTPDDACAPLEDGSLAGKAALIRRGTCAFHIKALNAQNAGAAAVVLYNNGAGRFSPTVAGTPAITIPVVAISDTEGVLINDRLASGPVTMTWTEETGTFLNPTGGLISSFSSYGLSPDLTLKPDIGAPGGLIYSTYPLEEGAYATISGTSMASPHVAGGVALLLEARPRTPPSAVRTLLLNTADPKNWWGNPNLGFLDQVHRQGAGMLDIVEAISATTMIEPSKIAIGETESGPYTTKLKIGNTGSMPVTYNLSYVSALATGGNTNAPGVFLGNSTVTFSTPNVTIPANGKADVSVTITGPANAGLQFGGYLVLTPQEGGQVYRVPFAGFSGDYQSIVALTPTIYGFPWLASLSNNSYSLEGEGATFTMEGDDLAYFLIHFEHQASKMRLEVFDAKTGRNWHRIYEERYLPRNSTATGFFAFAFDGTTKAGKKLFTVPDGEYIVKLSVLKAMGDENNPAHWETWTSPAFFIDRP